MARWEVAGLATAVSYRCDTCTAAGLHSRRGCTGAPIPSPDDAAGVAYPAGWASVGQEAQAEKPDEHFWRAVKHFPAHDDPIRHCIKIDALDDDARGWLVAVSLHREGITPSWDAVHPMFARLVREITGLMATMQQARMEAR